MHFIWFIVIGIIAGFLAGKVTKGSGYGIIMDLVLGIAGALFGGWVLGLLNIHFGGFWGSLVTATIGAILLIWIISLFKK